jgi:hypothetical protein
MEDSRASENETILENESCNIFSNQVFVEEEFPTKIIEENKSLQAQSKHKHY